MLLKKHGQLIGIFYPPLHTAPARRQFDRPQL
jgi:hypothetical protein